MQKHLFYFSGHLLSASIFHHNSMFFQAPLLVIIKKKKMLILYTNSRFWDPFKIQWSPKRHPKSTKSRQNDDTLLVAFVFFDAPSFLMHLCCPLIYLWHNFASNEHQNATPNQHLAPKSEQENPPPLPEGGQGVLDQRG